VLTIGNPSVSVAARLSPELGTGRMSLGVSELAIQIMGRTGYPHEHPVELAVSR